MTIRDAFFLDTFYSGHAADNLATARSLFARYGAQLQATPLLKDELRQLRQQALHLDTHMLTLGMDHLCSHCAAGLGGGCCSAFMADNTDSIQMLINLLLNVMIEEHSHPHDNCRFLGKRGCLFLIKPIFCLNYNCTAILNATQQHHLDLLYERAAAVLSQQTRVESLLLDMLPGLITASRQATGQPLARH